MRASKLLKWLKKNKYTQGFGLLILLFFSLSLSVRAQMNLRKYKARVKVYVKGEGEDKFKEEVRSYLNKELRVLSDVAVLEENAEWELIILAQELKTVTGVTSSIVLSTNVKHYKDMSNSSYYRNVKGWESANNANELISSDSEVKLNSPVVYIFKGNWLKPDAQEDLKRICKEIIADFDSIYLGDDRRSYQEMINYFEGMQNR